MKIKFRMLVNAENTSLKSIYPLANPEDAIEFPFYLGNNRFLDTQCVVSGSESTGVVRLSKFGIIIVDSNGELIEQGSVYEPSHRMCVGEVMARLHGWSSHRNSALGYEERGLILDAISTARDNPAVPIHRDGSVVTSDTKTDKYVATALRKARQPISSMVGVFADDPSKLDNPDIRAGLCETELEILDLVKRLINRDHKQCVSDDTTIIQS